MFTSGTMIGRYCIEQFVGQGGMGVVYRAVDSTLNRPVAIKLLAAHLVDNPDAVARFHREATAAANLKHSNIAIVYEFGEHEGQPFIAYEWVAGETLTTLLADGRISLKRALNLFDQLARALDYAHSHGVIHRDVKPANILVDENDHVTIVDFGLAWIADAPSITASGMFYGTPRYMSPEQMLGKPVDARSDLYGLALVLYEMLAGRPPFDDMSTPMLIHRHVYEPPPPITEFNPSLPPTVEDALTRALSKNPDERFQTAAALGAAMRKASPPASAPKPNLSRVILPITLIALFILLGLGSFVVLSNLIPTIVPITPTTMALPTMAATVPTSPTVDGGAWVMPTGDGKQGGAFSPALQKLQSMPHWSHDPQSKTETGLVVGRNLVVFGIDGGRLRALDSTTGKQVWETPLGANIVGSPALVFDDNLALVIISTDDRELHALNLDDGKLAWRKASSEAQGIVAGGVVVGSDGTLYSTSDTGWLLVRNPVNGEILWSLDLSASERFQNMPAVTAGSIFLASANQTLLSINPATGDRVWAAVTTGAPSTAPLVIENYGIVVVGTQQGWIHAFSISTGEQRWIEKTDGALVGLATDGKSIIATTASGIASLWTIDGKPEWTFKVGAALTAPITDGKRVIVGTAAGDVHFVDISSGKEASDWRITLKTPITFAPAPANGWLFVRSSTIFGLAP